MIIDFFNNGIYNNEINDAKFHNEHNKKRFFHLYKEEKEKNRNSYTFYSNEEIVNNKTQEMFNSDIDLIKKNISYRNTLNNNDYLYTYYIDLYITFYNFNLHYENLKNRNILAENYFVFNNANRISFTALNYNLGYLDIQTWKLNYMKVKSTIDFIEINELKVSEEIENIRLDLEEIDEFSELYFNYQNLKAENINEVSNFKEKLNDIKLKNTFFKYNLLNSIKYNVGYISQNFDILLIDYKKEKNKIEKIENDVKEIEQRIENKMREMEQNIKKERETYLTVTGSAIGLISLISTNVSSIAKEISLEHILLFNITILSALLVFSKLYEKIYTHNYLEKNENIKYNNFINKILRIIIVLAIFLIALTIIKLILKL